MNHRSPSSATRLVPANRAGVLMRTAAALWAALIFIASSVPGSNVPGRFGYIAHFVEYGVLGALLFVALGSERDRIGRALLAVALASAYAVTDEVHQAFTAGRTTDPKDWLVDTAGALLAVTLISLLQVARRVRASDQ